MNAFVYKYIYTCVKTYTHAHTRVRTQMHTDTHAYINMFIYTYAQILTYRNSGRRWIDNICTNNIYTDNVYIAHLPLFLFVPSLYTDNDVYTEMVFYINI